MSVPSTPPQVLQPQPWIFPNPETQTQYCCGCNIHALQTKHPPSPEAWSLKDPPAVVDGKHVLLEDLLGEDPVEDGGDAIDGLAGVAHPQHPIKPGKDEGEGRQRRCLGKNLDDGDV